MSRSPADQPGTPRWSVAALVLSVASTFATAVLGPSAAVAPLPGRRLGPLPPYFLTGPAPAEVVSALLAVGVLAGAAGLLGVLRALDRGWQPEPRRLLAAGALAVIALAVLPPVGSADPKSYAAYGRMAATGYDPYVTTPRELARRGDPVAAAVESPWQDSTSVYGPLATAEQALAARLAGGSPRAVVGLLGLINAAAFLATATLLLRLAGTPGRRRRVALLWSANPLLLLQLVAGAHLDTLVAMAVIGALALAGVGRTASSAARSPGVASGLATGAAAGAAAALKLPGGAVAAVLAWQARRCPARLAGVATGAGTVLGLGYLLAGPHALDQVRRASRFVSHASPWRPLAVVLDDRYGAGVSRTVISLAALAVTALLAALLLRGLPAAAMPHAFAVRGTLALTLAYLLATPYALPWYAATAWCLLTLLPPSGFDRVLVTYTTVLSLAYIPGRDVTLPDTLARIAGVARNNCAPFLLLAVFGWAVAVAHRRTMSARAEASIVS